MKKFYVVVIFLGLLLTIATSSYATTGVYLDRILGGAIQMEGTAEQGVVFNILGLDYRNENIRLLGEIGFGKRGESDLSVELSEYKVGYLYKSGGGEYDNADILATVSQLDIKGENDSFRIGGTAYGFDFLQAKPVEKAGACYIQEFSGGYIPKGIYRFGGVEVSDKAQVLFIKLKFRYQFTSHLCGMFGYRYYYVKLAEDYADLHGLTVGLECRF
jgi:hypothetical protein